MGNYCYVAVCSAARGAWAPTEGGEGREHIVAAARLQLVTIIQPNNYIIQPNQLKRIGVVTDILIFNRVVVVS